MEETLIKLTLDLSIGDIVAERCSLSRVFEKHKIDYCCGGKQTLQQACEEEGIDPQLVLNELKAQMLIKTDEKSWNKESLSDLIDDIQTAHHNYLWSELPQLALLIKKVTDVHGANHPELIEIRDIYLKLECELKEHLKDEENVVFPYIKKIEADQMSVNLIDNPIVKLEQEHDDAGEAFHRLRALTHDFAPPQDACNSYRAMLTRLHELESDMHKHVHKENSILFPRIRLLMESLKTKPQTS